MSFRHSMLGGFFKFKNRSIEEKNKCLCTYNT